MLRYLLSISFFIFLRKDKKMAEKKKMVFVRNDKIFQNSKCMFIEYHDIIRAPWFNVLAAIQHNKTMNEHFIDNTEIRNLNIDELFEWYTNRKFINIYDNLPCRNLGKEKGLTKEQLLHSQINSTLDIATTVPLRFLSILNGLPKKEPLVEQFIIYTEHHEAGIERTIPDNIPVKGKVEYCWGDLKEVLEDVPKDCTFVFSDIEKIQKLADLDRLNYTSVLIPKKYRYNYTLEDPKTPKVDIEALQGDHIFKFHWFLNPVTPEATDPLF